MPDHPIMKSVLSLIENDNSKVLHLAFGSRKAKPGDKIPKGGELAWNLAPFVVSFADQVDSLLEAQGLPTLGWNAPSEEKFLVVSLDLDAPFPSFAPLSPALHWLQAGLAVQGASGDLTSPDPAIASWAGPGPPPISGPHRYIFLLYEQPADFDTRMFTKTRGFGIRDRMRWDLSRFEKQAKLRPAVAATYFFSN
ncbi:uncharacterized protein Z519_00232 [Cladophialophora bantiana CBS 173.52]|uniref:Phosphatidylethanolamine-binding protein n=1 Tax=Cladophialophora bantiana (strain ATCC 10958 / CBS 173.52 / CDC B-1940 / NIH 8579) TaxID=1442370 RepID=A0A0D2F921_CLAB1|nr:uncharacterized protein Z519_00232 [Cladophialophora bantiana CBS 173.52]KIW98571.1 hypothetical protein Z519_00232 [Cladophialophora bantiana CBS 173.52]